MTQKITYVTSADRMDEIHGEFDSAIERVRGQFGQTHPMLIGGTAVTATRTFADISPIDTRIVLGHFQEGDRVHADEAVAAARRAFGVWGRLPWRERVALMRRLADAIRGDRWDLSALMGFECGKNRMECLGDVEESADLIDYYCDQVDQADGFVRPMQPLGPGERNCSVLRPYGVWAVISPFNFPLALAAGPAGAALAAGNTVVIKPATTTPWIALRFGALARDAGLPRRRAERRHRRRRNRRPGADRSRGREWRRVHRIEGGRPEAAARERRPRDAASRDHRDGRQESRDRDAVSRSRQGQRRRHALGVRRTGPEVFRLLARPRPSGRA